MNRQQAINHHIDQVMDEFDFRKVAEYMKRTEWTWHSSADGVPSESEIRKSVRETMMNLGKSGDYGYFSGGFMIKFIENSDDGWLRFEVKFVIEHHGDDATEYRKDGA